MNKKNEYQDEGLKGNERIEDAIFALQKEATQERTQYSNQFFALQTHNLSSLSGSLAT